MHPAREHHDGDDRRGSGVSGGPGGPGGHGGPSGPGGPGALGGPGAPGGPGGAGTMYLPGDVPDRGSKMSPSPAGGTGENNRRFSDLKGKECVCPRTKSPTKKAYLSQLRSPNSPMFCGKQSNDGADSTVPMMDCNDAKSPDVDKLPIKNKPIEDKVPVKDKPPHGTKESIDSKLPCLFNCKEVVAQALANCDKFKTQAPIAAEEKDEPSKKGTSSLHSCKALAKTLKSNGSPERAFPTAPSLMTKQSIPCNQNPSITFSDPNTAYGKFDETDAVSIKDNKKSVTSHPCASFSDFDGTSNKNNNVTEGVASKKNISSDPSGGHVNEDGKQRKASIDPTTYTPVKQLWTQDQEPTVQFQDGKKAEDGTSHRTIEDDACAVYTSAKLQDTKVKFTPYANVDPNDPCSVFTKYSKDETKVMGPTKGEAAESPVSTPSGGQKNQDGVEPVVRPCTVCGPNLRDVCAQQCHTNSKCSYECWASQKSASIKTICLCPENPDSESNKKSDKHKCGAGASKQR